ncbi:hypothetical protein M758_2G156900 [Ceratodon purpureus]|nr:hypothetical protein M758_2G156900 [Ceratodon purpureus]KAG0626856.1 hypothetical protein M758_2G156900 [Ceratodon purpureus]
MVHESVFDVIHDDFDESDYEDGCVEEDDEEAGQLQSGFKAMDITRMAEEEGDVGHGGVRNEDGEMVATEGGETGAGRRMIVWGQKDEEQGKNHRKKKNRKKRKGDRRKQSVSREQTMSIERFVVMTCRRIDEPKYPLFREAVDRIGVDAMKALLNQVDVIEKCGGQMTADGVRRRSAGGVLWNLLRDHVGPGLYKDIMKEGNRKHIEQQKTKAKERENEKGNGKRLHMDVDEQDERQNAKRRRTTMDVDGPTSHPGRGVSRERHAPRASLREEADNVRTPAALQNAWVQGLKKHSERGDLNPKPLEDNPPEGETMKRPVSQRIRMTVSYSDLVEEGQIATDSPILGVTEVGDAGVGEPDNLREEGEMAEEGEIAD